MSTATTVLIPGPRARHRAAVRARTPLTDLQAAVSDHARPLTMLAGGSLIAVTAPAVLVASESTLTPDAPITGQLTAVTPLPTVAPAVSDPVEARAAAAVAGARTREVSFLSGAERVSAAQARQAVVAADAAREATRVAAEQEAARKAAEAAAAAQAAAAEAAAAEEAARVAATKAAEKKAAKTKAGAAAVPAQAASASSSASATTKAATTKTTVEDAAPAVAASGEAAAIIATARNYLGVPYVWGGKTPAGFDCSGLTRWVYAKHGVTLPWSSGEQAKAGVAVSRSEARAGDLIFFGSPVHHVGIYLGDGKMLDAPRKGKPVQIRSVWDDSTIKFRRVL